MAEPELQSTTRMLWRQIGEVSPRERLILSLGFGLARRSRTHWNQVTVSSKVRELDAACTFAGVVNVKRSATAIGGLRISVCTAKDRPSCPMSRANVSGRRTMETTKCFLRSSFRYFVSSHSFLLMAWRHWGLVDLSCSVPWSSPFVAAEMGKAKRQKKSSDALKGANAKFGKGKNKSSGNSKKVSGSSIGASVVTIFNRTIMT